MFEIGIKTHFSAAHHLVGYAGQCSSQHGHNWEVEVFVKGQDLSKTGILMDFRKLKEVVKNELQEIDHSDLNKRKVFKRQNPTSENIARFLYKELGQQFESDTYKISRVTVRETPESMATYWEE